MNIEVKYLENCGKSTRNILHQCMSKLDVKQDDRKDILLIFDFLTESIVRSGNVFDGKVGGLIKKIYDMFDHNIYKLHITFAIKCFQKYNNADVKIEDIRLSSKILREEINDINPALTICFGATAISTLFGKQQVLKNHRNQIIKSDKGLLLTSTFSVLTLITSPDKPVEIMKDVLFAIKQLDAATPEPVNYSVNKTKQLNDIFSLDIETNGLNPFKEDAKILTIGVSDTFGEAITYNVGHVGYKLGDISHIKEKLKDENSLMIGHNVKFDALWLKAQGFEVNCQLYDTLVAYVLLNENSPENGLKYLSKHLTDLPVDYSKSIDTSNLENSDFQAVAKYNSIDADATFRIYQILEQELTKKERNNLMSFLMDVLNVLLKIEYNGVNIDVKKLKEMKEDTEQEVNSFECFFEHLGVNPNSSKQVAHKIYNYFKLPVLEKTESGQPSTSAFILEKLQKHCKKTNKDQEYIFLDSLLKYKKLSKLGSTFFDGLLENIKDGKIHTNYILGRSSKYEKTEGTVTGRLSSKNPNLQNIPRKGGLRELFIAPDGYKWLDADYSQLEMRVAAFFSKEKKLLKYFLEGRDFHTSVFAEMIKRPYDELVAILQDEKHPEYTELKNRRVVIKSINFGILYGAGGSMVQTLCDKLGVPISLEDANNTVKKWLATYPSLVRWIEETKQLVLETGQVQSPTGRTRHLPNIRENLQDLRKAVNFPIQTLASELCLAALVMIDTFFTEHKLDAKIVLTVHDSIGIIFNEKYSDEMMIKIISESMTDYTKKYFENLFDFTFDIPLAVDIKIGKTWK